MEGTLLAIGLLLTIGVTVLSLVFSRKRPFSWVRLIVVIVLWAVFVSVFFPAITNRNGGPMQILLLSSACLTLVITLPPLAGWYQAFLIFFTMGATVALTWLGVELIGSGGGYTSYAATRDLGTTNLYLDMSDVATRKPGNYPPGWLTDMPFAADFTESATWGYRNVPHPQWHSWLTGLYRLEVLHVAAWYPGGKLEGVRQNGFRPDIEFRPRPNRQPPSVKTMKNR